MNAPANTCTRAVASISAWTTVASLFALLFASFALAAYAWAQHPAKLPKVAILSTLAATTQPCGGNSPGSNLPCFMDAMRALGYVDGKNVSFEFRFAEEDYKKLPALASELVRLRPDVIYTSGGPGALAAATATSTIPIVVGPAGEATLTQLAGNLARPTANVTGFTLVSIEQELKCLQLLKELAHQKAFVCNVTRR